MNIETIDDIKRTCFLVPSSDPTLGKVTHHGLPYIVWGHIGIGKSSGDVRLAMELEMPLHAVYGAQCEPPDIGGAMVQDGKGGISRVAALSQIKDAIRDGLACLSFDEIATATPAVQTSMQASILTRKFGDQVLPPDTRISAASNTPEHGGLAYWLTPQLANRFLHINAMPPTGKELGDFLKNRRQSVRSRKWEAFTLQEGQKRVHENWDKFYPKMVNVFAEFLSKNGGLVHNFPATEQLRSGAWPSPRTWDMALYAAVTALALGRDNEFAFTMIAGCVGQDAADALLQYQSSLNLPSVGQVLGGEWKVNEYRLDISAVVFAMILSDVNARAASASEHIEWLAYWKVVRDADAAGQSDMIIPLLGALNKITPRAALKGELKKISEDLATRHSKIMNPLGTP